MLIDTIRDDMKQAMKDKDQVRLRTVRSIIAAVQEAEVSGKEATQLDDAGVEKVIAAQAKRRVEAAEAYAEAGRAEQEAAERAELVILETYLPEGLSDDEVAAIVDSALADGDFSTMSDMGNAMKAVNAEIAGRADGRMVADLVKSRLGAS